MRSALPLLCCALWAASVLNCVAAQNVTTTVAVTTNASEVATTPPPSIVTSAPVGMDPGSRSLAAAVVHLLAILSAFSSGPTAALSLQGGLAVAELSSCGARTAADVREQLLRAKTVPQTLLPSVAVGDAWGAAHRSAIVSFAALWAAAFLVALVASGRIFFFPAVVFSFTAHSWASAAGTLFAASPSSSASAATEAVVAFVPLSVPLLFLLAGGVVIFLRSHRDDAFRLQPSRAARGKDPHGSSRRRKQLEARRKLQLEVQQKVKRRSSKGKGGAKKRHASADDDDDDDNDADQELLLTDQEESLLQQAPIVVPPASGAEKLHDFLMSPAGRYLCLGYYCWESQHSETTAYDGGGGGGCCARCVGLSSFGSTLSHLLGTLNEVKEQERGPQWQLPLLHRAAPFYFVVQGVLVTVLCFAAGVAAGNPASCSAARAVAVAVLAVDLLYLAVVRPHIVRFSNHVAIVCGALLLACSILSLALEQSGIAAVVQVLSLWAVAALSLLRFAAAVVRRLALSMFGIKFVSVYFYSAEYELDEEDDMGNAQNSSSGNLHSLGRSNQFGRGDEDDDDDDGSMLRSRARSRVHFGSGGGDDGDDGYDPSSPFHPSGRRRTISWRDDDLHNGSDEAEYLRQKRLREEEEAAAAAAATTVMAGRAQPSASAAVVNVVAASTTPQRVDVPRRGGARPHINLDDDDDDVEMQNTAARIVLTPRAQAVVAGRVTSVLDAITPIAVDQI